MTVGEKGDSAYRSAHGLPPMPPRMPPAVEAQVPPLAAEPEVRTLGDMPEKTRRAILDAQATRPLRDQDVEQYAAWGVLTREQVDAEKATKSRPDLIPGLARLAVGRVQAAGFHKHGDQTWKVLGTEQANPQAHIASAERHLAQCQQDLGALNDTDLPHLWHAAAQLLIAIECIEQTKTVAVDQLDAEQVEQGPGRSRVKPFEGRDPLLGTPWHEIKFSNTKDKTP